MAQRTEKKGFFKRLVPLLAAQTFGVYNDNAFKALLVFIAIDYAASYSMNSFFLALMTVVFVAPFMIFTVPAGYCADKFSKKKILISSKFAETLIMLLGAVLLAFINKIGLYPLIIILFLMAAQSSFFSPALNSVLPETFSEKEISRANGILVMLNFIAVIVGFTSGIILKVLFMPDYVFCGLFFTVIGLIGFAFSLFITKTKQLKQMATWNNNIVKEFFQNLKLAYRERSVFISVIGEAFFYGIGSSLQTVIILFARFTLELKSDIGIGLLQIVIAVGIAVGCFLAGKFSKDKLELGLVAIGGLGMFIFVLCTAVFIGPGLPVVLGSTVLVIYPNVLFFLTMAGVCGGVFVLPLKVCQQERTLKNERGRILAISNFCTFFVIFISGIITYGLTGKSDFTDKTTNNVILYVNSLMLNLSPDAVIYIIAIILLTMTLIIILYHREFLYRCIAVIITRTIYQVECRGLENLPVKGPAIIASNHVTLIDPFIILSSFSRQVTFAIHRNYQKHKLFKFIYKRCNFIIFSESNKGSDYTEKCNKIKNILERGGMVCVFPEAQMTRDGMLGKFVNNNFSDFIPEGLNVPIVPVHISNLWGSIFSYYFRETGKMAIPEKYIWKVTVSFARELPVDINAYDLRQRFTENFAEDLISNPMPGERTIHYHFMKRAKTRPFHRVIAENDGNKLASVSLLARSIILSKKIRELNDNNKYIGVLLPNCNAATVTCLAIMFADKVPALLNFTLPKESITKAINKAQLNTVISSELFMLKLRLDNLPNVIFLEKLGRKIRKNEILKSFLETIFIPSPLLIRKIAPKSFKNVFNTSVLLFSSGSSGSPKGIKLSHHNINSDLVFLSKVLGCKQKDKIVGNLPLFHSFGLIVGFWMPLMLGVKIVYIKNPLEINTIIKMIERYKLTIFMATPTFLQGYMRKLSRKAARSLKLVVSGAEKLRPETAEAFYKKFNLYPTEGYGCTELSPVVTLNIPESIADLGKKVGKKGSIGRPIPGIAVKIVNPDDYDETLPPNQEGVLFVKGPNVMVGYLDSEKTREAMINGWYNTGDMGKIDEDSYITLTGRLSRFSKIGGEMVSHQMLENVIQKVLNAEERKVAVAGVPDKAKGEKLIVFYSDDNISPEKIVKGLKREGVTNICIPKKDDFIKIDELPMLGTGKLDISRINKYASYYSN